MASLPVMYLRSLKESDLVLCVKCPIFYYFAQEIKQEQGPGFYVELAP